LGKNKKYIRDVNEFHDKLNNK